MLLLEMAARHLLFPDLLDSRIALRHAFDEKYKIHSRPGGTAEQVKMAIAHWNSMVISPRALQQIIHPRALIISERRKQCMNSEFACSYHGNWLETGRNPTLPSEPSRLHQIAPTLETRARLYDFVTGRKKDARGTCPRMCYEDGTSPVVHDVIVHGDAAPQCASGCFQAMYDSPLEPLGAEPLERQFKRGTRNLWQFLDEQHPDHPGQYLSPQTSLIPGALCPTEAQEGIRIQRIRGHAFHEMRRITCTSPRYTSVHGHNFQRAGMQMKMPHFETKEQLHRWQRTRAELQRARAAEDDMKAREGMLAKAARARLYALHRLRSLNYDSFFTDALGQSWGPIETGGAMSDHDLSNNAGVYASTMLTYNGTSNSGTAKVASLWRSARLVLEQAAESSQTIPIYERCYTQDALSQVINLARTPKYEEPGLTHPEPQHGFNRTIDLRAGHLLPRLLGHNMEVDQQGKEWEDVASPRESSRWPWPHTFPEAFDPFPDCNPSPGTLRTVFLRVDQYLARQLQGIIDTCATKQHKLVSYKLCAIHELAPTIGHQYAMSCQWQLLSILYLAWRESVDEEVWASGENVREDPHVWTTKTNLKARSILELEMWRLAWKRLRQEDGPEMCGIAEPQCTEEIHSGRRWAWKQLLVVVYGPWNETMREHAWTLAQILRSLLGYLKPVPQPAFQPNSGNTLRTPLKNSCYTVFRGDTDVARHPRVFCSLLAHLSERINETTMCVAQNRIPRRMCGGLWEHHLGRIGWDTVWAAHRRLALGKVLHSSSDKSGEAVLRGLFNLNDLFVILAKDHVVGLNLYQSLLLRASWVGVGRAFGEDVRDVDRFSVVVPRWHQRNGQVVSLHGRGLWSREARQDVGVPFDTCTERDQIFKRFKSNFNWAQAWGTRGWVEHPYDAGYMRYWAHKWGSQLKKPWTREWSEWCSLQLHEGECIKNKHDADWRPWSINRNNIAYSDDSDDSMPELDMQYDMRGVDLMKFNSNLQAVLHAAHCCFRNLFEYKRVALGPMDTRTGTVADLTERVVRDKYPLKLEHFGIVEQLMGRTQELLNSSIGFNVFHDEFQALNVLDGEGRLHEDWLGRLDVDSLGQFCEVLGNKPSMPVADDNGDDQDASPYELPNSEEELPDFLLYGTT